MDFKEQKTRYVQERGELSAYTHQLGRQHSIVSRAAHRFESESHNEVTRRPNSARITIPYLDQQIFLTQESKASGDQQWMRR